MIIKKMRALNEKKPLYSRDASISEKIAAEIEDQYVYIIKPNTGKREIRNLQAYADPSIDNGYYFTTTSPKLMQKGIDVLNKYHKDFTQKGDSVYWTIEEDELDSIDTSRLSAKARKLFRENYREPVDQIAANELTLYIINDSQLYRGSIMPVVRNLARKKAKGIYDKDLAIKAFEYVAKAGADKYRKNFGDIFYPATRNAVAKELLNEYEQYINELAFPEDSGKLDEDIEKTKSGKWVNKGKEGTHGEFKTKKAAREQQKAMFAQGFKEGFRRSVATIEKMISFAQNSTPATKNKLISEFNSWNEYKEDQQDFENLLYGNNSISFWNLDTIVRDHILDTISTIYKNNSIKENIGSDIAEYQKWVDYDMKKYGKISDDTNEKIRKAGLKIVKDKYGDYEVIANEPIHEKYTLKQQKVLDAFYKDMNFGFDSNKVTINKVTDNTVEYTLDGVADVYKLNNQDLKEDLNEPTIEEMFKYLKEYPQYNGKYTRPVKYYDLGLTPEEQDEFFNFIQDEAYGLENFWEENADLSKDIYQEGRQGGHLVLDKSVYLNHVDVDSVDELIELELEENYYPDNEDGTYTEEQKQEAKEEVEERIKGLYNELKDFDERVDKLIANLKATLDARIKNKDLNEDVSRASKKSGNPNLKEELSEDSKTSLGVATILDALIKDELEAIDGYNGAIATLESEGYSEFTEVLNNIINDEKNHIGNLQELLNKVSPDTHTEIQKGKEEAKAILDDNTKDKETKDKETENKEEIK